MIYKTIVFPFFVIIFDWRGRPPCVVYNCVVFPPDRAATHNPRMALISKKKINHHKPCWMEFAKPLALCFSSPFLKKQCNILLITLLRLDQSSGSESAKLLWTCEHSSFRSNLFPHICDKTSFKPNLNPSQSIRGWSFSLLRASIFDANGRLPHLKYHENSHFFNWNKFLSAIFGDCRSVFSQIGYFLPTKHWPFPSFYTTKHISYVEMEY